MDCVRPLSKEEDDMNAWNPHNLWKSFSAVVKSPFRHTYGIRNAGHPVKGPLFDVREAAAKTTTAAFGECRD